MCLHACIYCGWKSCQCLHPLEINVMSPLVFRGNRGEICKSYMLIIKETKNCSMRWNLIWLWFRKALSALCQGSKSHSSKRRSLFQMPLRKTNHNFNGAGLCMPCLHETFPSLSYCFLIPQNVLLLSFNMLQCAFVSTAEHWTPPKEGNSCCECLIRLPS